jgi:hypothetical protein
MGSPAKTAQEAIHKFWDSFISSTPTPVPTIFPKVLYSTLLPPPHPRPAKPENAAASYEAAVATVKRRVERIARECRRTNEKFTDADFDIKENRDDTLFSLNWSLPNDAPPPGAELDSALATLQDWGVLEQGSLSMHPGALRRLVSSIAAQASSNSGGGGGGDDVYNPDPQSVHRVGWIFDAPAFSVDGFSSSDIKQGANGDCWWLSAVATIAHRADLMARVCAARDEACGVYGFVFCRDGEWLPVVVDDYLFLRAADFSDTGMGTYDPTSSRGQKHRRHWQRGSEALFFSSCADENETWLPLMEKAYAKVHGDYNAIYGGYVGEGVEDLTGGVATDVSLEDILDKGRLWKELVNVDGDFVFGLDILDDPNTIKNGLASAHAYSLLQAREEVGEDGKAVQLVQIRYEPTQSAARRHFHETC